MESKLASRWKRFMELGEIQVIILFGFSSFVKTQFKEEIKYELRGDISTVNGVSRVVSYSESKCID